MKLANKQAEKAVENCAKCVKAYCLVIEQHRRAKREGFLRDVLRTLSNLYAAMHSLPDLTMSSEVELREISHKEWESLFLSLGRKLGPHDQYWIVFDSYANEKPIMSSLADDLADIYRDTKPGLELYLKGKNRVEAAGEWQTLFINHWGHHAASALRALQQRHSDWWLAD